MPRNETCDGTALARFGVDQLPAQLVGLDRVVHTALAWCNPGHRVHAGLAVVPARRAPETVAATDVVPVRVNWLQHELHEGPDLEAHSEQVMVVRDLAAAGARWHDFGRLCTATLGIRAMFRVQVPLMTRDRASLSFYAAEPTAFDQVDVHGILRLAQLAAPQVTNLMNDLRQALVSAAKSDFSRVAVAVGIVMARDLVSSQDAFSLLCRESRRQGRTLLDLAIEITAKGRPGREGVSRLAGRHRVRGRVRSERSASAPNERPYGDCPAAGAIHAGSPTELVPAVGGPEMWREPQGSPPAQAATLLSRR